MTDFFIIQQVENRWLYEQLLKKLHTGEALCICMENNAELCLLDDKDARETAKQNTIYLYLELWEYSYRRKKQNRLNLSNIIWMN